MNSLAITLVLLSGAFLAVRDFLSKKSGDKQIFVWAYNLIGLFLLFPVSLYFFLSEGGSVWAVPIGMISGIFGGTYLYFVTKAYNHGDLSHVFPIARSTPAVVLLFSVLLLNEKVSLIGVGGIIFVTLGIYIVNMRVLSLRAFFEPMTGLLKEKAAHYALIAMIMGSGYSLIDKVGIRYAPPLAYLFITEASVSMFLTYALWKNKKTLTDIKNEFKNYKGTIILNGFLGKVGYAFVLIALQFSKVSYVTGLRQVSILFAMLLGAFSLKEAHKEVRALAAFIIVIGLVCITVG